MSLVVSTHAPEQFVWFAPHVAVQVPPLQRGAVWGQVCPQPPQFAGFEDVLTQLAPQAS